jgi:predicted RNase H-like nuclease (RuvC/YqgF family)
METIGSAKAKQNTLPKKYTLEDWKKEADAARKRAEYWKKQSISWEQKYFVFQENVNTEIEAIGKDLDSALATLKETQIHLKWAHEGNQELLERCKNAEALELASKAEIKVRNVEISLLKSDFETKQSELEIIEEDYNQFKADSLHTRTLAWVGWIMFFISIFGMIFLRN